MKKNYVRLVLDQVSPSALLSLTVAPSPHLRFSLSAIGFNVETVQYKNIKFQVWDLGQ